MISENVYKHLRFISRGLLAIVSVGLLAAAAGLICVTIYHVAGPWSLITMLVVSWSAGAYMVGYEYYD